VEEITPIHLQLPAAKPPVRAEEEMKPEEFILVILQSAPADKTKIGDIFFIPTTPNGASFGPSDNREASMTDMFFLFNTVPESGVAEPEDVSQDAVTGHFLAFSADAVAQSKPLALHAGFFRYCDCFRAIPISIHE
jgi:hypothetical protein